MVTDSPYHDEDDGYAVSGLIDEPIDCRLTSGTIPELTLNVNRRDGRVLTCSVRSVGSHEIVLYAEASAGVPAAGESVTFSLLDGEVPLIPEQLGLVHWVTTEEDTTIVGLFTLSRLELPLEHWLFDDRRTDIRYPVDLPAFVRIGCGQEAVRVVNYSMNGLCLLSQIELDLNRSCRTTIICDGGSFSLSVEPHWVKRIAEGNLTGCSLHPHYGVLFARRHTFRRNFSLGN